MGGNRTVRQFAIQKDAVSEEFAALPALCVVLIGLAVYLLVHAHAYMGYQAEVDTAVLYHTAELLTDHILNPTNGFVSTTGALDPAALANDTEFSTTLQEHFRHAGFGFLITLSTTNVTVTLPSTTALPDHRLSVRRVVAVSYNEAQVVDGSLTVLLWRADP
jgi:hypothetical protein